MLHRAIILLYLICGVLSDDVTSPRIVIVGAGASGIAAASKLLENGFENVLILEAEDRIGGRVHTTKLDEYVVDLGAQWVHGEKGNVAYAMAAPLDLIEHATMEAKYLDLYEAPGKLLNEALAQNISDFYKVVTEESKDDNNSTGSVGKHFEKRFNEFFEQHPEINETLQEQIMWQCNLYETGFDPGDTYYDISAKRSEYVECEGDNIMNWKERGYSTILDILMKKIPNPEEELPVLNKTVLNTEVVQLDYTNDDGTVKIKTQDGLEYTADHVIMTPSLGVLKAQHETLFDPPLSESKINSIKGLGYGNAGKIFLAFNETWFEDRKKEKAGFGFLWDENQRKASENNPEKKWVFSIAAVSFVQYKPRLLHAWVSGEGSRVADSMSDDVILNEMTHMLNEYLSEDYNVTAPIAMKRSRWSQNKHFRGTYSYRSIESDKVNASADVLSEPILKMEKPVILFAGEATNKHQFSTVHGAIGSGWREADRLISLYKQT